MYCHKHRGGQITAFSTSIGLIHDHISVMVDLRRIDNDCDQDHLCLRYGKDAFPPLLAVPGTDFPSDACYVREVIVEINPIAKS